MKQFFKIMFASMLGTFLLFVLVTLISIGILAAIVATASSDDTVISKNTVLRMTLSKAIVDRGSKSKIVMGYAGPDNNTGLNDLLDNLKKAKKDDNVAGIYMDLSDIPAGIATVDEIRDALIEFKTSGKFIWAYSEAYSQKSYYLATAADKIFLNPQGVLDFKGLASEMTFLKGMLETGIGS